MRFSYMTALECSVCGQTFPIHQLHTYCPNCQAPILARYDLSAARAELDRDLAVCGRGMWRWHSLLPVQEARFITSLGEGDTPLLALPHLGPRLGLERLSLKDEGINPTGSFKARGLSAAVSRAFELGVKRLVIPTAGNAGGALAAYASRAGLKACIYMPADTPIANIKESQMVGAEVVLVDGLISDAAKLASARASAEGWFDISTFKEPYRAEGKKVMGYEIAENYAWQLPDVILYPTGGGTGLVAIWKAIQELETLGWLETHTRPRMVAVQAEGCAPVVRAMQSGSETCQFWTGAETHASGLRVPKPFADRLILQTIQQSGGTALAVSEEAIRTAQRELAETEGIFAAPEGAATLAGLKMLQERGLVHRQERVLLLNTGTGLKYLDLI